MADYLITFARSARKELESLPVAICARVFSRIESLAANPRPVGSRKLQTEKNRWRVRVGEYRVVYTVDDKRHVIDISAVRHRSDAYR